MGLITQMLKSKINGLKGKPIPIKLTVALTFSCNSRCKTCGIWKIYRGDPGKCKDELVFEDWRRLFDEIADNIGWVEFTGGEPTLKRDAAGIIAYAYTTKIFAGGLITNAVLPRKSLGVVRETLSEIPDDKILDVGISLDGLSEVHDEIRGVPGNFESALWLFEKLKSLESRYENLAVHFAYTASEYNVGRFREFYEFLRENYGVSIGDITITLEHFADFYRNKSRGSLEKYKDHLMKDVSYCLEVFKRENRPKNFFEMAKSIFYIFYLRKIPSFLSDPKKIVIPCVAGTYSAYVDPYGNVYPCVQWNVKLGDIRESSFKEIWWGREAEEIREKIKEGKCPNCWTPCEAKSSWVCNLGLLRGWR